MFKLFNRLSCACMVFLMVLPLVSCGGGGGSGSSANVSGGSGSGSSANVSGGSGTTLWITDAPPQSAYQAVFVTIVEGQANHETEGWKTFTELAIDLDLPQTINLLEFTNGLRHELGIVDLPPGHYNQMRLILSDVPSDNWVVDSNGNQIPLKVPSGGNTGIKTSGFDIASSESTDLILDFDVNKSIHAHPAGQTGTWRLRPTIRVVEINNSVEGTVEAGEDDSGALVSAQLHDPSAEDTWDEVVIVAGSFSEDDGTYFMNLPINISDTPYNIVATKEGFDPECTTLASAGSAEYTENFTLTPAVATGTLIGSMTGLVDSAELALFSIRQAHASCNMDMIEVASSSIAKTVAPDPIVYFDPITLPVGTYQVVVSGFREVTEVWEVTQVWEIQVDAGETTVLDVNFPTPSVYGIVYDGAGVPLPGATISAQEYDDSAAVAELEVTEIDDTSSDSNGVYNLYLLDDRPLNIVATMTDLEPQCGVVTELTSNINFTLNTPAVIGTVTGSVSVDGLTTDPSALFSIRQTVDCGLGDTAIEVLSFDVDEGTTSAFFTLPVGDYEVVVSAADDATLVLSIVVADGLNTDVVFPAP